MKFFAITVSIISAMVSVIVDAAPELKARTLTGTSVKGLLNQRKIMEKAVRVDRTGKRILNDNNNFELTSAYSIYFDQCVSLSTEPKDEDQFVFNDSLLPFLQSKEIVPQSSYVLFSVCKTSYCDYYEKGDNMYMIDLATYMDAIAEFYAEREEQYCEACMDSFNYCQWYFYQKKTNKYYNQIQGANVYYQNIADQEEAAQEAAEEEYQANGGGRRELNRNNFELIDCDVCSKMHCFYSEQVAATEAAAEGEEAAAAQAATVIYETEEITEWVNEVSQCQATEAYFLNYYLLYAGFMCNEDGSGVDIATFLDDECTIYNSMTAYSAIASTEDQGLMVAATDMITYPFLHRINCNSEYAYLSMDEYRAQASTYGYNNANNNQNQNNNANGEISEYCATVFKGGDAGNAVALSDCNADGQKDQREEGDEEVTAYFDESYGYTYTLSNEAAEDMNSVCMVVRNMQGEYETVYRWAGSGQLYNYGTGPTTKAFYDVSSFKSYLSEYVHSKMGKPLIAGIVIAVLVAVTAFGCILYSCCSPASVPNKYVEQRTAKIVEHRKEIDNKRERLVDISEPDTGHLM